MAVREWLFGVIKRFLGSHHCEVNIEGVNVDCVRFGHNGYHLKLVSSQSGPVSSVIVEPKNGSLEYDCDMVYNLIPT